MGLREMANFLAAQGHPEARFYPLPVLWLEARMARRRINREMASEATLLRLAVASVLSKKAGSQFKDEIKRLTED